MWISDERRVDVSRDVKFLDILEDTIADKFEDFYNGKEEPATENELSVEIELCPNEAATEMREEDALSEEEEEAIEELVEDRRDDPAELHALEQRLGRVGGELEDAPRQVELRELAVEERRRRRVRDLLDRRHGLLSIPDFW